MNTEFNLELARAANYLLANLLIKQAVFFYINLFVHQPYQRCSDGVWCHGRVKNSRFIWSSVWVLKVALPEMLCVPFYIHITLKQK